LSVVLAARTQQPLATAENEQCQFKMRLRADKQLELPACGGWGGARTGSGQKPMRGNGPSHVRRPVHEARWPVHVTLRARGGLPSLRAKRAFELVSIALGRSGRPKFRVIHFSVQTDHIHLIVEADSSHALSRGVQGLAGRCARALNRSWARRGRVWGHRYHAHALRTPTEVRNAIAYVLLNFRKHLHGAPGMDPLSSGRSFDGWSHQNAPVPLGAIAPPRTWLASAGWRKGGGVIDVREKPGRS
jgi:REP element-mobilizing transposase RayT